MSAVSANNPNGFSQSMSQMKAAKSLLLLSFPFWGILCSQLKLIEVEPDHPFIRTAGTDGRNIYYNPEFMELIGANGRLFVLAHEIGHIIWMTLDRRGSRDFKLWNWATDYAINHMIIQAGFSMPTNGDIQNALRKMGKPAPSSKFPKPDDVIGLYDKKYASMTAEQIYEDLKEQEKNGSLGGDKGTIDQHIIDGSMGNASDDSGGDGDSKEFTKVGIVKELDENLKRELQARITQANMQAKQAGHGVVGMDKLVNELNAPKVNWRQVIAAKLTSCKTSDWNWSPPDDAFFGQGITLPQIQEEPCLRAALIMDASGSMQESELREIMSEAKGVAEQFPAYEILIVSFDSVIHNPKIYTESDYDPVYSYKLGGGGGTAFGAPFRYLNGDESYNGELCDFEPDVVLFFTDGEPGDGWQSQYSDKFDVVWFITGGSEITAPWGLTVKYDKYD